jgi:hypothetical protein
MPELVFRVLLSAQRMLSLRVTQELHHVLAQSLERVRCGNMFTAPATLL